MLIRLAIVLAAAVSWTSSARAETPASMTERFLMEGKLAAGEKALTAMVAEHPNEAEALFGLGTIQFLRATEHLVQSLHRYGMRTSLFGICCRSNGCRSRRTSRPSRSATPIAAP